MKTTIIDHTEKRPNQILVIAEKNLKEKLVTPEALFFTIGFPLMFTLIFYFVFASTKIQGFIVN